MSHRRQPPRRPAPRRASLAIVSLAGVATLAPRAVFAAEAAITNHSGAVVFIVILLLVASVTAGIVFAIPIGRRPRPDEVAAEKERAEPATRSRPQRMPNPTGSPPDGRQAGPPWSTNRPQPGAKWHTGHRRSDGG